MAQNVTTYRGVHLVLLYNEVGQCQAYCNDPIDMDMIETEYFDTPEEAIESLKKSLDTLYFSLK